MMMKLMNERVQGLPTGGLFHLAGQDSRIRPRQAAALTAGSLMPS
jgi:hypothetical protein